MAVLWVLLGLATIFVVMAVVGIAFGRGHLGVEQTESHYLDEVGVMAPVPGGYITRRYYG